MKMFTFAASAAILAWGSAAQAQQTLSMWYHGAGNEVESKIINQIIADFNGSQTTDANDNLTNAHIHGSAAEVAATRPVVWGFYGTPFNDVNSTSAANCQAMATGVGFTCAATWNLTEGQATTLADQIPNIFAGRTYINFHTNQFPGGEIRGALTLTPEPATVVLLASGLAALGVVALRRRRGDAV